MLEAAAAEISAALDQGELPLLTASDCSICIATLPTVARRVPGVRFLWIDAHGDFNTPETTPSGFLGGMCLGAACGRWDAGWPDTIDPSRCGSSACATSTRARRSRSRRPACGTGVPEDGPVYVHLDFDGLDPSVMPVQFPVPGGLSAGRGARRARRAASSDGRLVGLEVTAFEHPEHLDAGGRHPRARHG